jgi:hypothetical protein
MNTLNSPSANQPVEVVSVSNTGFPNARVPNALVHTKVAFGKVDVVNRTQWN